MTYRFLTLILALATITACEPESKSAQTSPPAAAGQPATAETTGNTTAEAPDIDLESDFVIKNNYGVIRGSKMPDDFNLNGSSRYFNFGDLEVRTEPQPGLTGEKIYYRQMGAKQWQNVPEEDYIFFIGFDGTQNLIIDRGTGPVNRNIRLFNVYDGQLKYMGQYNDSTIKNGFLYAVRFEDEHKLDTLPDCNTSPAGKEFIGYQKVVAVRLNDYQETTTGQVACAYMKRQ